MKFFIRLMLVLSSPLLWAGELSTQFATPPKSARPWVYWFWNNGNVTKAGIHADLEAMQRVGIGGVILMDVVERFAPPPGTADFMNPEWRELFQYAVGESNRLGLEINMTNGPGWCGSSGPWITPELSMQRLVAAHVTETGPSHFSGILPSPNGTPPQGKDVFDSTVQFANFYQDIAVLAYPLTADHVTEPESVLNLTDKLDKTGKLDWDVPAGQWIIQRIGHASTGSSTRPPVKGGNGLECDKLSREAMDVHFKNMMGKLINDVGPLAGPVLSATHIDSWEVGGQNWTPKLREVFQKRRGYDPLPLLPNLIGKESECGIGDAATVKRFRWDFQQTISELLAQNYVGHLAELAHQHGMRLSIEGYNLPFGDEACYTARADEPMSEFWATGGNENDSKGRQMASVAHVMGRKIIGAEAFTSNDSEQWKFHPATVKALGDSQFCQGINRFVIHRYAHQPYLDRFPGATMGPWGLHYERTQTWWEMSAAWHEYLSRCQFMLRQGLFVADLCYLRPELPDQTYFTPVPAVPPSHKYDECSAGALIARMTVKDGRLVLPDGMSYRLLVLPANSTLMTPRLAEKIKELVAAGATVMGPRPAASPSLSGFPKCDEEVKKMADEVWADCDGKTVTEHAFGKGKVIWGEPLEAILEKMNVPADFSASTKLNWIHRRIANKEVYFVANKTTSAMETKCTFRVTGLSPELWDPETGKTSRIACYEETAAGISIPLRLEASGSVFVVFRPSTKRFDPVIGFTLDGQPVIPPMKSVAIQIQKASYGVPGDPARTRDVTAKVRTLAKDPDVEFLVASLAAGDDPAYGVVKTLEVEYTADGQPHKTSGQDPDTVAFRSPTATSDRAAEVSCDTDGRLSIAAWRPGNYELKTANGNLLRAMVEKVPESHEILGSWELSFPPNWGAPDRITLDHLSSLSESPIDGVKHFSGTMTYRKSFDWNPPLRSESQKLETWLDLGDVQIMAQVTLNGRNLGVVWKPPFRMDITGYLKPGANRLEIQVANLWPNRMIGDAALPKEKRFTWSSYEPFTKDSPLPKSGLLGPVAIQTGEIITPQ